MVRWINKKNIKQVTDALYFVMHIQEYFTHIAEFNNPGITPCIYAMWHQNQFCVYGLPDKGNVNILISNSLDGEIIAKIVEKSPQAAAEIENIDPSYVDNQEW